MSVVARFKQPIERRRPQDNTVHLHWAHHQGPKALRDVTRAISLCGLKDLTRDKVTSFPEDATCKECKRRADV